jgi:hypothetical protein
MNRVPMKILLITTAWTAVLSGQTNPPLEDILERTGRNVQALRANPDFACKETKVTKQTFNGPFQGTQTQVSILTRGGDPPFWTSRQVLSVKGGETGMADLILNPLADLIRTFAPESRSSNNYKFDRRQNFRGTSSLVVEFETRKGASASLNSEGSLTRNGDPTHTMKGKAWIDSNTLQVLRLELSEIRIFSGFRRPLQTVADYGPVTIDGKAYWMVTKILKTDDTDHEWRAEYSDCRKFEVTSEIRPPRGPCP